MLEFHKVFRRGITFLEINPITEAMMKIKRLVRIEILEDSFTTKIGYEHTKEFIKANSNQLGEIIIKNVYRIVEFNTFNPIMLSIMKLT